MASLQGNPSAVTGKVAIVAARFNAFVVDPMVASAMQALETHGISASNITVVSVPGAFELPVTVEKLALTGCYEAIIALGAVIRGGNCAFRLCRRGVQQGIDGCVSKAQLCDQFWCTNDRKYRAGPGTR